MPFSKNVSNILGALENSKQRIPLSKSDLERLKACNADFPLYLLELEFCADKSMEERLGISKSMFIPEPELDNTEIKALVDKILDVWSEFNYFAEFPNGLPLRIAYKKLLEVWDEPVMSCMMGSFHFDFYAEELEQYVDLEADPDTIYLEEENFF